MKMKFMAAALMLVMAMGTSACAEGRSVDMANSSFEEYLASWICEGDGISAEGWGTDGESDIQLKFWLDNAPYSRAYKTLYNLAPGRYEVSAYVRGGGSGEAYMYAKSGDENVKNSSYTGDFGKQSVIIDATDGRLEIGFGAENGAGLWYNIDDVQIVCTQEYAADCGFVENGGFENGTEGFSVSGAEINENGRVGNCLYVPSGSEASVRIADLPKGAYEVSLFCRSDNADSVVTATDGQYRAATRVPCADEWEKVTVSGVYSGSGALDISVSSGGELYIDDVTLEKLDSYRNFIAGGDISAASYVESCGGKYYDADGNEGDVVALLAEGGMNMARVRVYNQTGRETATDKGYGMFYMPDGFQDEADALALCRRAKESGMQLQFTFHYSDFWTNGERQEIPLEWRNMIEDKDEAEAVAILEEQVYLYTLDIMTKLKAQGTLPELVSVGNEIQFGMLYPYGNVGEDGANWANLARFLNAGYRAVKEISPSSRVILHLDECGNFDKYNEFFGQCTKNGVNYDVIGASYYPYWSQKSIEYATEFCNTITDVFDKDIIIMETGYNFHPTRPQGWEGQLKNNGVYEEVYPPTPEGHKRFMAHLFNSLKGVRRCIGDLYWDPIMLECEGVGWAMRIDTTDGVETDYVEANVVSNTALFDFDGKALPSLAVFADSRGADYELDVLCDSEKERFTAVEKNGAVKITNISDKDENIVVLTADYDGGELCGVSLDKRTLKPDESGSFENGRYTFVWTAEDIRPITTRNPHEN